jgi:hypothetical protein
LLGGSRTVLAFANVVDFLAHELTGLRARRLSGPLVLSGARDGSFLGHRGLLG